MLLFLSTFDFFSFSHFVSPLLFSDDGSVRVWRNLEGETYSDKSLEMVTAWQALSGMLPSTRGTHEPRFELETKSLLDGVMRET